MVFKFALGRRMESIRSPNTTSSTYIATSTTVPSITSTWMSTTTTWITSSSHYTVPPSFLFTVVAVAIFIFMIAFLIRYTVKWFCPGDIEQRGTRLGRRVTNESIVSAIAIINDKPPSYEDILSNDDVHLPSYIDAQMFANRAFVMDELPPPYRTPSLDSDNRMRPQTSTACESISIIVTQDVSRL